MAKDILKDAISDAKAVREVALANAKAALEEAFTPKLQSMLSAKLSEDLNEEYDEDDKMEEMYYDEDDKDNMEEMMYDEDEADEDMKEMSYDEDEADEDMKESDLDEEIDLEEILNELELEEGKDDADEDMKEGKDEADEDMKEGKMKDADEDMKEGKDEADEDMKEGKDDEKEMEEAVGYPNYRADQIAKVKVDATDVNQGLNEGEEFDLDALLEEINNLEEEKEDKDDVKEGMSKDEEEYWKMVSSGTGGFDLAEMNVKTDEEWWKKYNSFFEGVDENIDEMRMPMSPREFEDFARGKGHSDEFIRLMTGPMGPYGNMMEDQTNEVVGIAAGLAGVIAAAGGLTALEMAADDPEFKNKYPKVARALEKLQDIGKAAADAKRMEEETKDKELEEVKKALEAVQTELNEVNLLNSKLLYVNRIFKANTLDESQKLRVVETLDKAETTKEAKLIYETIKDTFNVAKSKKESFKNKTKSLKEGIGMASKAAGTSTAPKKEVISESSNMVNRFQKLANITINE